MDKSNGDTMINDIKLQFVNECEEMLKERFDEINHIALINQYKVLKAFQSNTVSYRHFNPTTGYGYDDIGKNTLARLFADVFHTEDAIVSPLITSGTQALTLALFAVLRPNDNMIAISGKPYDTLATVINGKGNGSLRDFGIGYSQVELLDGKFDFDSIKNKIDKQTKLVFIGRSRGYDWRDALSIEQIGEAVKFIKKINKNIVVMVDNCYGEFVSNLEPSDVGADMIVGSLIKNIGGGLAPTGGYIAGRKDLVELVGFRLTAPSIGNEVGSYASGYQAFYQGLFCAPSIVAANLKGSALIAKCYSRLGYEVLPKDNSVISDIITSIKFGDRDKLIKFCQMIQKCSPIDSNVIPEAWDMPGYETQVIMAAGTFVQGASIELSCDSPVTEPYVGYLQGGLNYEHIKLALIECLDEKEIIHIK